MELIDRQALLNAYDAAHQGPPGGARKLIEQAPAMENECIYCAVNANAELESTQTATSEPHILNLDDQQKEWLSDMTAVQRLDLICQICSDWDGYRTATKLGDLINEIWTYANYPVKANTAQTARIMTLEEIGHADVGYIEGLNYVDPVLLLGVYSDETVGVKFSDEDGECYLYIKDCGKTWRIWTQRPTDEQRKAVKWND